MKRNSLIVMMLVFLLVPVFVVTFTSCAGKAVKKEVGLSDEEKARLEAERLAKEKAAAEEAAKRKQAEALAKQAAAAKDAFLNKHVYFDFDQYSIRPEAEVVLQTKADYLSENGKIKVEVQGHCDERGTDAYNMALGDRRAKSAVNFLENLGVDPSRMTAVSYGESKPLDPGRNEAAYAKNRRAQFVIMGQ